MKKKIQLVFIFIAVIWGVFIVNSLLSLGLNNLGILPREVKGLWGIVCAPFLHGNLQHIISNSIPLIILTLTLVVFYEKIALEVIAISTVLGGILVWIIARKAYHIGASGLIFSLAAFLILVGILRKNLKSLFIAIIIFFLYGLSMLLSFTKFPEGVSWEGHLFGAIAGAAAAFLYRSKKSEEDVPKKT